MPFTLERNAHNDDPTDHRIGIQALFASSNMTCIAVYNEDVNSLASGGGDRVEEVKQSSSSSSSIGKNSTDEEGKGKGKEEEEEEEVQSKRVGRAFDNLHELEKVLPIKRSISQFYYGKSKSFTSLRKAESCTTIEDIVKPENAYSRKRKNLLAYQCSWENDCNGLHRSNSGGIIKKHMSSKGKCTPVPMKTCDMETCSNTLNSNLQPCGPSCLPPLPPPAIRSLNNDDISSLPLEQKIPLLLQSSSSDLEHVAVLGLKNQ